MTTVGVRPGCALLLALGVEGSDRAIGIIARRLRESGYEVVVGRPDEAARLMESLALHEPAVVGMSIGRGSSDELALMLDLLRARRGTRWRVFAGGRLSCDQVRLLMSDHDVHVFALDATTDEVVAWLADGQHGKSGATSSLT